MKHSPFKFECFDSKNTSTEQTIPLAQSVPVAQQIAKRLSMKYHHVIVSMHGDWEKYEHAERTEWSYPDGLPIK